MEYGIRLVRVIIQIVITTIISIFVVIVLAFRKGLVGEIGDWWKARRK